ncbi:uncharacterized protein LOC119722267 [Patiria miniata]|uniref:Reverse transcriptase domain-containing protein n=1 Tax=Patiria miniata TaxID=46514 RepID=A0A913Z914_PATMI|nr:uncharacterized protein LOC119722267 [Patiria miniata]
MNDLLKPNCMYRLLFYYSVVVYYFEAYGCESGGVSFGDVKLTDLDYADDVAILAELMDIIHLALEAMNEETTPLGLSINWDKTKIQSLSDYIPAPTPPNMDNYQVVEKFCFLGNIVSSDCRSKADIQRRLGLATSALARLNTIWKERCLSRKTKLSLYNSLVLSILLYGSETWTLSAELERKLDAFDTKALRHIEGIYWQDFMNNKDLRLFTNQPPVSHLIRASRLRLFGHIARADPPMEPVLLLKGPAPNLPCPRGRPRLRWTDNLEEDLMALGLNLSSGWRLAQNRLDWKLRCGDAMSSRACEIDDDDDDDGT